MNIEELSKAQLILLTILVNFVTSVATVILVVSLLDQAPTVVTQTINRVVDRTIEKVVQAVPAITAPSPAPSNQDLVTAAIAEAELHTVAIYDRATGTSTLAIALGTYLPSSRSIATAARDALPKDVLIKFANNTTVPASLSHSGNGLMIYGFTDSVALPKMETPVLVESRSLRLGQTALAIGVDGSAATGIVARVSDSGVRTTLPEIGSGSAAFDLSGNVIGISAGGTTAGLFVHAETITKLLTASTTPR